MIAKIKNDDSIQIDTKIPVSYFCAFCVSKMLGLVWGTIRMRSLKKVFISPSSTIKCAGLLKHGRGLMVGKHCTIDALGVEGITLGDNVHFGDYSYCVKKIMNNVPSLGKGIKVGNNVGFGTHGFFGGAGGVEIGDDTIIGNYVSIHPENHNYKNTEVPIRMQGVCRKGIKIGKGCWIGAKATILDGTVLGDGCIVAAGAVVNGNFPPMSILGGVPAKIIKLRIS